MNEHTLLKDNLSKRIDLTTIYSQILGLPETRLPRSVSELPITLLLPSQLLGDMEAAIFASEQDKRERRQFIDWDTKSMAMRKSKLFIGDQNSTASPESLVSLYKIFFGSRSLLEYHTHPGGSWTFSKGDITVYTSFRREAYIHAAVSKKGISFIFRTEKSAKIPISTLFEVASSIIHTPKLDVWNIQQMSEFFKQQGFGYYLYVPKNMTVQHGEFRNGLVIEKR